MKSAYDIIETILVTEKNTDLQAENKYVFKVDPEASKIEIAQAVASLFEVKVKSVNIMNYQGKPKRAHRSFTKGRRANWKKAVVTLSEGTIDLV